MPLSSKSNQPVSPQAPESPEEQFEPSTLRRVLTGAVIGAAGAFALDKLGDSVVSQFRPNYNFSDFVVGTNLVGAGGALVTPFYYKGPLPLAEGYARGCGAAIVAQASYFALNLASQTSPLAPPLIGAVLGAFMGSLPTGESTRN